MLRKVMKSLTVFVFAIVGFYWQKALLYRLLIMPTPKV